MVHWANKDPRTTCLAPADFFPELRLPQDDSPMSRDDDENEAEISPKDIARLRRDAAAREDPEEN